MTSEDEMGEWAEGDEDALSAIIGARAELTGGDLRPLYLAWLSAYRMWDEDAFEYEDENELEPPIPPGLGSLSAPQRALADFLRLDPDLLTVAAEASPALPAAKDDASELADWIIALPPKEKDDLLVRVVQDQATQVRMELLRRFRGTPDLRDDNHPQRTVAELLNAATERHQEGRRRAEAARAAEMARRECERALAREKRLEALADDQDTAWSRIGTLISARKPSEYDAAVDLLKDLRALAQRADRTEEFARRFTLLRQEHHRKPTLIERFDRAGLTNPATTR